jgi:mannosyltransferase OCH1-like enzyme
MPIPKKIHYCWLSGDRMPVHAVKCINSWKNKMPEYQLVLWDKNKFDITSVPFVKEACRLKKWTSAAYFIRLYALYSEGGIYMDTDVYAVKSFDDFLSASFFTSLEYDKTIVEKENAQELLNEDGTKKYPQEIFTRGIGIQAAILGSIKGHAFVSPV